MTQTQSLDIAISLVKSGNKTEGRALLAQIVQANPANESAWLWLSSCLDDLEQKKYCLQKALEINPKNEKIQQLLEEWENKGDVGGVPRYRATQLFVLSLFLDYSELKEFPKANWNDILGKPLRKVVSDFADDGLLIPFDPTSALSGFNLDEIKPLLKERGLSLSGNKKEIIVERLIQADPIGMRKATNTTNSFDISESGKLLSEQYLSERSKRRHDVEILVKNAVREKRFSDASSLISSYESKELFPYGIETTLIERDKTEDEQVLNMIFQIKQRLSGKLSDKSWNAIQVATALYWLWEKGISNFWVTQDVISELENIGQLSYSVTEILFQALYRIGLERGEINSETELFKITNCNDSGVCYTCWKLHKRLYTKSALPKVPHKKCTNEGGCRCSTSWFVSGRKS